MCLALLSYSLALTQDTTTNPSIILAAVRQPKFKHLVEDAVAYGVEHGTTAADVMDCAFLKVFVNFGEVPSARPPPPRGCC
jgi:transaldolase